MWEAFRAQVTVFITTDGFGQLMCASVFEEDRF